MCVRACVRARKLEYQSSLISFLFNRLIPGVHCNLYTSNLHYALLIRMQLFLNVSTQILVQGFKAVLQRNQTYGKVTKGVLFMHDNAPAHRALANRRNPPIWFSSVLITHPILRIWPRRNTICSLDWKKKQLKDRYFSPDTEVIAASDTWLDGQPSVFLGVACKS
jgi:hypothetical protein